MDVNGKAARRLKPLLLTLALFLPAVGCARVLATAVYLVKGTNQPAEYDGLKDKRVAVVCRPLVALQYRNSTVAQEIARQVGLRLGQNVPKVRVIDQQEVANWTDENTWQEFSEIGRALEADMVVAIELESFGLYQGQTLYQGRASVQIKVYDMKDGGKLVFEKTPDPSVYPPNTGIPTSEKQENHFRRQYIAVLADEIGRHFYDHDTRANFAIDSTAF